jgi:hypothetical protein
MADKARTETTKLTTKLHAVYPQDTGKLEAMINNHLQLEDAKRAPWLNGHHQNKLSSTTKNNRRRRGDNANKSSRLPPKRGQG